MIRTIHYYRNHWAYANCPRGFVVTGSNRERDHDQWNRDFVGNNEIGMWIVAPDRVLEGDAMFVLLPNPARRDGYLNGSLMVNGCLAPLQPSVHGRHNGQSPLAHKAIIGSGSARSSRSTLFGAGCFWLIGDVQQNRHGSGSAPVAAGQAASAGDRSAANENFGLALNRRGHRAKGAWRRARSP